MTMNTAEGPDRSSRKRYGRRPQRTSSSSFSSGSLCIDVGQTTNEGEGERGETRRQAGGEGRDPDGLPPGLGLTRPSSIDNLTVDWLGNAI